MTIPLCLGTRFMKGTLMFEDVFGKLKSLHDEVRTRLEATPDWKALTAVERAMSEVKALLPVAAEEKEEVAFAAAAAVDNCAQPVMTAGETEPATAEVEPVVEEAAAETPTIEEVASAEPAAVEQVAAEVEAESPAEAASAAETEAPTEATIDAADKASAVSEDAPAEPEVATEATPENVAESVVVPEIPAEHKALVEEIVSSGGAANEGSAATT